MRRMQRNRRKAKRNIGAFVLVMGILIVLWGISVSGEFSAVPWLRADTNADSPIEDCADAIFTELQALLEKNEETLDYVAGYPEREKYKNQVIDLTQDFISGEVPLLMQWDLRWGYDSYGDSMIGLAGCGPVCLTMAYLYFTEDTDMTPREMAAFAYDNGYYSKEGTSWSLWTEGVQLLGLDGAELPLDENVMKRALDAGGLIVCSMRPGDFTTSGHFILIRGYDEGDFYVNDPNRRSNSQRPWNYETLQYQIKNLWVLQYSSAEAVFPSVPSQGA